MAALGRFFTISTFLLFVWSAKAVQRTDSFEETTSVEPKRAKTRPLLQQLIEERFHESCPLASSSDLTQELLLRNETMMLPISFNISVMLFRLLEINDLQKSLTATINFWMSWYLPCRGLTPDDFPEIGSMSEEVQSGMNFMSDINRVWYPVFYHINAVTNVDIIKSIFRGFYTYPMSEPPTSMLNGFGPVQTSCEGFSFYAFPFDALTCSVMVVLDESVEDMTVSKGASCEFAPSLQFIDDTQVWFVTKPCVATVVNATKSLPVQTIFFTMYFKRKYHYYALNIVFPMITIFLMVIVSLLMRPELPDRSTFCITVVLAASVILSMVNGIIPQTDETVLLVTIITVKIVISACITVYSLLSCTLSHEEWTQRNVKWGAKMSSISLIRMVDIFVATVAISLALITYAVCFVEIYDYL